MQWVAVEPRGADMVDLGDPDVGQAEGVSRALGEGVVDVDVDCGFDLRRGYGLAQFVGDLAVVRHGEDGFGHPAPPGARFLYGPAEAGAAARADEIGGTRR